LFINKLISEEALLKMAKQAEDDYRNGKTKALKSLSDLLKKHSRHGKNLSRFLA